MAAWLDRLSALVGKGSAPLLGVDLGESSVRMVALTRDYSGAYSVEFCGSERLQPGWVVAGSIQNLPEVVDTFKRLMAKGGGHTKNAVMALPSSTVITRRIKVQADLSEADFELQVETEVNPYLPWSVEDAALDFHVLKGDVNQPEVDVLVAACKREMVDERSALADEAGLKLVALDVEPFARMRAVAHLASAKSIAPSQEVVAIVEIGSVSTLMQISKNDEIVYDRDLSFGGAHLTQLIERVYGLSAAEAERQKRSRELPSGYETKVVMPYITNVAIEIERELQAFHSKSGLTRVSSILMSGGGACLSGLAKAVSNQTGLPCSLANPFIGIGLKSDALRSKLKIERPAYLTSVGLALRVGMR